MVIAFKSGGIICPQKNLCGAWSVCLTVHATNEVNMALIPPPRVKIMVVIIKPWGIQSIKGRRSLRRGVSAEEVQLIATKLRAFPPSTHSVQQ